MDRTPAPATTDQKKNVTCAVCREVYSSPRFLPCFHTFCLSCLEGLAATADGSSFLCPTCRRSTDIPLGGVQTFQVNFYIAEDELERARRGVNATICPAHTLELEPLAFLCVDCDSMICIRCKLTEHENHKTEDLTRAGERCKRSLSEKGKHLQKTVNAHEEILAQIKESIHASRENRYTIKEKVTFTKRNLLKYPSASPVNNQNFCFQIR